MAIVPAVKFKCPACGGEGVTKEDDWRGRTLECDDCYGVRTVDSFRRWLRGWRHAFGHLIVSLLMALMAGGFCAILAFLVLCGLVFPALHIGQNWDGLVIVRLLFAVSFVCWFLVLWCCEEGSARPGRGRIPFAASELAGAVVINVFVLASIGGSGRA